MADPTVDDGPGREIRSAAPASRSVDPSRRARRRLLVVAVAVVVVWVAAVAATTAVATGAIGDLGLPADGDEGRPRGLLVIGASTVLAAVVAAVVHRRTSAPVADLLGAAEQVFAGDYEGIDLEVRGPREVRELTSAFNVMAARLAADEERRRRFLADITHELHNPLAVLQSEIEAQLDGVHPRDDAHLSSLLEETQRIGHLVDDLHTLALAESGRLVLQREAVPLDDLVAEVVDRHGAQARSRGVTLEATVAAHLRPVWADPGRLRQVLDNLMANAIRHTPTGGAVTVLASSVRPGADRVRCQVTDAGPGFPPAQLVVVFERFTRAGDTRGSGLGLSIARDLVHAHGGTIEASNAPGGGAVVTFSLPTAPASSTQAATDHQTALAPAPPQRG